MAWALLVFWFSTGSSRRPSYGISWISWKDWRLKVEPCCTRFDAWWRMFVMMRIWEFDRICWTWFRTMVHQISWAIQNMSKHQQISSQSPIFLTFPSCFVVPPLGSRRESWQCPTMETWIWMMQRFWCYFNQWSMGFVNGICWDIAEIYMDLLWFTVFFWDWMGLNGMLMESINITIW